MVSSQSRGPRSTSGELSLDADEHAGDSQGSGNTAGQNEHRASFPNRAEETE